MVRPSACGTSSATSEVGAPDTALTRGTSTRLSRFGEASAAYEQGAVSLGLLVGDRRAQAITLVADARLLRRLGEYQEAQNSFEAALGLLEPMGDVVWEGATLTGIALALSGHGRRALLSPVLGARPPDVREGRGSRASRSDVLTYLGETYLAAGDEGTALSRLTQSRPRQGAGDHPLGSLGVETHRCRPPRASTAGCGPTVPRAFPGPALPGCLRASPGDLRSGGADAGRHGWMRHELLGEHDVVGAAALRGGPRARRVAEDRVAEARGLFGLARASAWPQGPRRGARRRHRGAR